MINKERSMFPTSGNRTHWRTSDGRLIHVYDLTLSHLANILIQLREAAEKILGIDPNRILGEYTRAIVNIYLYNNCLTWEKLRMRGMKEGFLNEHFELTQKCREYVGNGKNKILNELEAKKKKILSWSDLTKASKDQYLVNIYRFLDRITLTDVDVKNLIVAISKRVKNNDLSNL